MAKVIDCVKAHYEVQDLEMGKVYRWCPERAVVECTCGEELTLSAFSSTCPQCGADHAATVDEVLAAPPEHLEGARLGSWNDRRRARRGFPAAQGACAEG